MPFSLPAQQKDGWKSSAELSEGKRRAMAGSSEDDLMPAGVVMILLIFRMNHPSPQVSGAGARYRPLRTSGAGWSSRAGVAPCRSLNFKTDQHTVEKW